MKSFSSTDLVKLALSNPTPDAVSHEEAEKIRELMGTIKDKLIHKSNNIFDRLLKNHRSENLSIFVRHQKEKIEDRYKNGKFLIYSISLIFFLSI